MKEISVWSNQVTSPYSKCVTTIVPFFPLFVVLSIWRGSFVLNPSFVGCSRAKIENLLVHNLSVSSPTVKVTSRRCYSLESRHTGGAGDRSLDLVQADEWRFAGGPMMARF